MGVTHLQTFLHAHRNISKFCYDVDIKDLVEKFKSETGSKDVILVIDGICFLYEQYDVQKYDSYMGGQFIAWLDHLDKFIKKFKNIGVKLVFFFDGSIVESRSKVWVNRQKQAVERNVNIFSLLKYSPYSHMLESSDSYNRSLPTMIRTYGRYLLKYIFGCEVHVSVGDCDREMADFAKANNCFAIMTQDTDFMIFKGARYYLSMKFFDLDRMSTVCYNQNEFASSLGLQVNQLPLLATFLGNDYVSISNLQNFHLRLCGYMNVTGRFTNINVRISKVAKFVQAQPVGRALDAAIPRIAMDVFGNTLMVDEIITSINSYTSSPTDHEDKNYGLQAVLKLANQKHVDCEIPKNLYPLLLGRPYEIKVSLEDFSAGLPAIGKIYLPLRQRIYGILLHESTLHNDSKVEEWCVLNNDLSNIPQHVNFSKTSERLHPGLYRLWSNSATISQVRWQMFANAVSSELSPADLQKLPLQYIVPVVTLHYLLHKDRGVIILKKHEADAFLSQAVLVCHSRADEMKFEMSPTTLKARMVHISSIIGRGINTVILLMASCGFDIKNFMPWLYFDGKMFQIQYDAAEKGISELTLLKNKTNLLQEFRVLQEIAYQGTSTSVYTTFSSANVATSTSTAIEELTRKINSL